MTAAPVLFEDIFDVIRINPEGKKFERCDRIQCRAKTYDADLYIDVASDIFPCRLGDKLKFALAWTLDKSGKPDSDHYEPEGKVCLAVKTSKLGFR